MRRAMPFRSVAVVVSVLFCLLGRLCQAEDALAGMPWFQALSMFHFPHLWTVDLDEHNFASVINSTTSKYVMVEFYAPWCPHCQHFAPEYERLGLTVSRFNNASNAARSRALQPPFASPAILSATVDCVAHEGICQDWGVTGFPTLLWGMREDWQARAGDRLKKINVTDPTTEAVEEWLGKEAHIDLSEFHVSRQEVMPFFRIQLAGTQPQVVPSNLSSLPAIGLPVLPQTASAADLWDVQVAVGLLIHNAVSQLVNEYVDQGAATKGRAVLANFTSLLARRFPEHPDAFGAKASHTPPCRESLAALSRRLDGTTGITAGKVNNSDLDPDHLEQGWQLCGTPWVDYGERGWRSCRGTWPGKRGFTCGLWTLFHAVAAQAEDEDAASDLHILHATVSTFFDCDECRKHFEQIPVNPEDLVNRQSVQLWWWRTHNNVNRRVKSFEDRLQDGDPAFPKVQWPSPAECPSCRLPKRPRAFLQRRVPSPLQPEQSEDDLAQPAEEEEVWDFGEVASFLKGYYSPASSHGR